jgi:hypothetical protein
MRSRLRWLSAVGPAAGAFVLARAVLWLASLGTERSVWDIETWGQWDSAHYLSIAERGYILISCREVPGMPPREWCGNAGWMPGYPMLVRAAALTGLDFVTAGVLVSVVFAFLTLALIDVAFVRREPWRVRLAVLGLAALFPGSVYFHAIFPMSLAAFLEMLAVRQLASGQWLSAGLAGWGLAFSYTTGVLGALPSAAAAWLGPRPDRRRDRIWATLVSGGLCLAGLGTVLGVQWWMTGAWNALFLSQHKYRHAMWFPLGTLLRLAKRMTWVEWDNPRMLQGAQSVFVAFMVVCAAVVVARRWQRTTALDRIALAWALTFWLGPMTLGPRIAFYRTEALVLPVVLVTRRLPLALQAILAVLAAIAAFGLARLFFQGRVA